MQKQSLIGARILTLSARGDLPAGYLTIVDGRIQHIGSMDEYRPGREGTVLDLTGLTILPGLIDSHCHLIHENAFPVTEPYITRSTLAGAWAARTALEGGLTSVRDVGCRHGGIYSLKAAIEQGELPGPRFQTAGRPLSGTGIMETWRSHSYDGSQEILRGVRREWQAGANWIKLSLSDGRWRPTENWQDTPLYSQEEVNTAVTEAHAKDMRVACHVDGPLGAALAVTAGVDSIEHGVLIPDQLLEEMADQGIALVPTVWIYSTQDLKVFAADLAYLNDLHSATIARAKSLGISIVAGVDCSYHACLPLEGMVSELETLIACGLTESEAIEAATLRGARLLGWDQELGSLEPGKQADLVVVEGDPKIDIRDLLKIQLVFQQGDLVVDHRNKGHALESRKLSPLIPSWIT